MISNHILKIRKNASLKALAEAVRADADLKRHRWKVGVDVLHNDPTPWANNGQREYNERMWEGYQEMDTIAFHLERLTTQEN